MKFAALAREVYINPAPAPVHQPPPILGPGKLQGKVIKKLGPLTLKDPEVIPKPFKRKVTLSMGGPGGKKPSEAVVEVLEGLRLIRYPRVRHAELSLQSMKPTKATALTRMTI